MLACAKEEEEEEGGAAWAAPPARCGAHTLTANPKHE
jgi:hypothetical protein